MFKTWLGERDTSWRDCVEVVAMDGFTGFKTATSEELPDAVAVMEPFHVVRLAGDALGQCRRRVQQVTCGHRGRKSDPLYARGAPSTPAPRCSPRSSKPVSKPCSRSPADPQRLSAARMFTVGQPTCTVADISDGTHAPDTPLARIARQRFCPDTEEVTGSNPVSPTRGFLMYKGFERLSSTRVLVLCPTGPPRLRATRTESRCS